MYAKLFSSALFVAAASAAQREFTDDVLKAYAPDIATETQKDDGKFVYPVINGADDVALGLTKSPQNGLAGTDLTVEIYYKNNETTGVPEIHGNLVLDVTGVKEGADVVFGFFNSPDAVPEKFDGIQASTTVTFVDAEGKFLDSEESDEDGGNDDAGQTDGDGNSDGDGDGGSGSGAGDDAGAGDDTGAGGDGGDTPPENGRRRNLQGENPDYYELKSTFTVGDLWIEGYGDVYEQGRSQLTADSTANDWIVMGEKSYIYCTNTQTGECTLNAHFYRKQDTEDVEDIKYTGSGYGNLVSGFYSIVQDKSDGTNGQETLAGQDETYFRLGNATGLYATFISLSAIVALTF